jgi:hypothetical protein
MLHCTMKHYSANLKLGLEDLLADLWHARRGGDLGRLALLCYYEVRRWARLANEQGLAEHSSVLVTGSPYADRESFMSEVDRLIAELEHLLSDASPVSWSADSMAPEVEGLPGRERFVSSAATAVARH